MIKNTFRVVLDKAGKLNSDFKNSSEVAWENISQGAKAYHLGFVTSACIGWLRANPDKTVQDLEQKLRSEKIPVHLIASTKFKETHEGKPLVLKPYRKNPSNPKYALIFSCRPDADAIQEIKQHWESYSDNYKHLPEAGALVLQSENETEKDELYKYNENPDEIIIRGMESIRQGSHLDAISYNAVVLECQKMTQDELLVDLHKDTNKAKEFYQKTPTLKHIGTAPDGSPVSAFLVNDKLVSGLGLMTKKDDPDHKNKRVVNLQDKSTWTWEPTESL